MIDFQILGGLFDLDSKINRKEEIEKLMLDSSFWDDSDMANELTSELKEIKSVIQSINNLDDHISSNIDLLNEASDDEDELSLLIFDEYKELKRDVDKLEIQTYLNGEYDGERNILTKKDIMDNEIMLGMRKLKGINILNFKNKFGIDIEDAYPIKPLLKNKDLIKKGEYIFIAPDKLYVMNEILMKMIQEGV